MESGSVLHPTDAQDAEPRSLVCLHSRPHANGGDVPFGFKPCRRYLFQVGANTKIFRSTPSLPVDIRRDESRGKSRHRNINQRYKPEVPYRATILRVERR